MKKLSLSLAGILFFAVLAIFSCTKEIQTPGLTSEASPKPKLATPVLTCGTSTGATIEVVVTAGATGAPAGFSLQWMTEEQYIANGNQWYSSESVCKASFSGNANGYFYSLAAGQSVTITIGDILYDNPGASTNCGDALKCGTKYLFKVFAHANNTVAKSDMSQILYCSTLPCADVCSYSQGYWFNNGGVHAWPGSITVGNCTYDEATGRALKVKFKAGGVIMQSFLQASAIKLSFFGGTIPSAVQADLNVLDAFLATLSCLDPLATSLPSGSSAAASAAAANISTWINNNHCK